MTSFAAPAPQGYFNRSSGSFLLSALFMAFCYVLLSWRAVLLNDAAPLFGERRTLALLVGTALFWLVLKRLDSAERVTLARTASWIVAGTAMVLCVRLLLDWLLPAETLTINYSVRWSLAWGAYFGLWVMGAITFRHRQARSVARDRASTVAATSRPSPVARSSPDELAWLVDALSREVANLDPVTRDQLADRIVAKAGGYELADAKDPWSSRHNARLAVALRVADGLRAH